MSKNLEPIIYHYTKGRNWKQMNEGVRGLMYNPAVEKYVNGEDLRGLFPQSTLIPWRYNKTLSSEAYKPYSFGFLKPEPKEWICNKEFPHVWKALFGDICDYNDTVVLLEADISDIAQEAQIFDWGVVEKALRPKRQPLNQEPATYAEKIFYKTKNLLQKRKSIDKNQDEVSPEINNVYEAYWNSRVPFSEYAGSHSLPEVAVRASIPLNKIKLVWEKSAEDFLHENNLFL